MFLFLPLVLILHTAAPQRLKNPVLLVASLFFYAWGEPVYVILMALSIAFNYVIGLQLEARRKHRKRVTLVFGIIVNLMLIGVFKYYGFAVDTFNHLFGASLSKRELALPIGISFYTFQALSYLIDVYRAETPAQRSIVDFATYITMFPQLVAGPIVKYTDIEKKLKNRSVSLVSMGRGIERLTFGLAKKVLLANNLGLLYTQIRSMPQRSVLTAWLGVIAYTLQIYFDFSGYSDMAIGMGKMLGFTFAENFDHPYISKSITEFWRRWHISLSGWFRDYVYIPLGGSRVPPLKHIRNILVVWALTGLWHGASWNFVLWGLYYGILLILEKYLFGDLLKRLPSAVSHAVTLFIVLIGWVIFSNTDFTAMCAYLGTLFGIGACGFADTGFLYLLRSNILLVIIAAVCCMPRLRQTFDRVNHSFRFCSAAAVVLLLIGSVAMLVYGTYNPFLYFRF